MDPVTFVIYDFSIREGLSDKLFAAKSDPPPGHVIECPGADDRSQGEIWRDVVKPSLDRASSVVAFLDRPNANVAFEVGYFLGLPGERRVALASHRNEVPEWLTEAPFKGVACRSMPLSDDLREQVASASWFTMRSRPQPGSDVLLLCPRTAGNDYRKAVLKQHPTWVELQEHAWALSDLPERLEGVGFVVWIVLPHVEGEEARDGRENTNLAVVAGYAESLGIEVWTLVHQDARDVCDVAARAIPISGLAKLANHLTPITDLIALRERERERSEAPQDHVEAPIFLRPVVAPRQPFDFAGDIALKFVGRQRLLAEIDDAVGGLAARARGERSQGAGAVQLAWYHGFGGMGKSWFLRQAMLRPSAALPTCQVALIDWDSVQWRQPLMSAPTTVADLCEPIAHRLAQQFGVEALDDYWRVDARIVEARSTRASLWQRYLEDVDALRQGDRMSENLVRTLRADGVELATPGQRESAARQLAGDSGRMEALFRKWAEFATPAAFDPDATLRADELRIRSLAATLRQLATRSPVVLALDTCEVLAEEIDRWLRLLVAPVLDGSTPVLVLIASRLAPDIAEPPGSRTGWRAEIENVRFRSVPFDEGVRLTVVEIEEALRLARRPVGDSAKVAEALHRLTLGVPLAVRSLIDMHEDGEDCLSVELLAADASDDADDPSKRLEERVVEAVSQRFLQHLLNRPERRNDLEDIVLLSLLPEADRGTLEATWKTKNIRGRLATLAKKYSLLVNGDLHATVRSYLRRRWRMEDRPAVVDDVAARLNAAIDKVPNEADPGSPAYMRTLLIGLHARSWLDSDESLNEIARAVAVALAYDEHHGLVMDLTAEVLRARGSRKLAATLERYAQREVGSTSSDPTMDDALLAWLDSQQDAAWSQLDMNCLNLVLGLRDSRRLDHERVVARLEEAMDAFGPERMPRKDLAGEALIEAGQALNRRVATLELATRAYSAAIRLGHSVARATNNLGNAYDHMGRPEAAEAAFRRAVELNAKSPLYLSNLGMACLHGGKMDEAESWLRKSLSLKDDNEPARRGIGNLHLLRGDYGEAESWLRRALEVNPASAKAEQYLAYVYILQRRWDDAEVALHRAMGLDATEPRLAASLGDLFKAKRDFPKAEGWYRQALVVDPSFARAESDLGELYMSWRRWSDAEAAFRRAIDLSATTSDHACALGNFLKARRRYGEAEHWYRRALATRTAEGATLVAMADLLARQRRTDEALKLLQPLEGQGAQTDVQLMLMRLYRSGGSVDASRRCWEACLPSMRRESQPNRRAPHEQNALAWDAFLGGQADDEGEQLVHEATMSEPWQAPYLHTLACIQLVRRGWPAARDSMRAWLHASDGNSWDQDGVAIIIRLMQERDVIPALCALMSESPTPELWAPWLEAIRVLDTPEEHSPTLDPEVGSIVDAIRSPLAAPWFPVEP